METILDIKGLVKRYRNGEGVNQIDLTVHRGEIVGLLGANGAGKTTTLRCIAGFYVPQQGRITLAGHQPGTEEAQQMVAFVPDNPSLYPTLTVAEHLQFKAKAFRTPKNFLKQKVQNALQEVNLESYADRYAGNLSRGQKQRVLLAGAVLQEAELYLLDEPTVGLDIPSKQWLAHWLKKNADQQKSVLISTHSLDFVLKTAHRVLLLKEGKIIRESDVPRNQKELDLFRKQVIRDLGGVVENE